LQRSFALTALPSGKGGAVLKVLGVIPQIHHFAFPFGVERDDMDRVQMVNNRNMLIASLLLLSLGTMPVYADGAGIEWDILNQEANDLSQRGEYARAVVVAKEALDVAAENVGWQHPDVAISLNNLATLYTDLGNYAEAEPLYKRAMAIREKALGPDHPNVANVLENPAGLYYNLGNYAKAEPLYKRAMAIDEKALGPDHPNVANVLENLAVLYRATNRINLAVPLEQRAAQIRAIER